MENHEEKVIRELDGVYFRVAITDTDGRTKYVNRCFRDLTKEQMKEVLKDRSVEWLTSLCCMLGETIANIGDSMDIFGTETALPPENND